MIGPNYCKEAGTYFHGDAEDSLYPELISHQGRQHYVKCQDCAYHFCSKRKQCERIACMRDERRDGKSIIMVRG